MSRSITNAPPTLGSMPGEQHLLQLDALRAFAVFGVLISHFTPHGSWINRLIPWGYLGVKLFFVLSGFLITGILLRCKKTIEDGEEKSSFIIRQFYIRRFLRIFPLYYLVVALAAIMNFGTIREFFYWHVLYASNFIVALRDSWIGLESHFWSLSVEEQYYLFWPCLVIFTPRKYLTKVIYFAILLGPVTRLVCMLFGANLAAVTLTPACLDSLGLGALLAVYSQGRTHVLKHGSLLTRTGQAGGLLLIGTLLAERLQLGGLMTSVLRDTFASMLFTWLVWRAAQGFRGVSGTILQLKPLAYVGKISYGIYIYHNFTHLLAWYPSLLKLFGLTYPASYIGQFALKTTATVLVASLSWHLFELPINNLKKYFAYKKHTPSEKKSTSLAPTTFAEVRGDS